MKAIARALRTVPNSTSATRRRLVPAPLSALGSALAASCALSACVPAPRTAPPAPPPPRAQRPLPPPVTSADWRDAPVTPGTWRWGMTPLGSTATFGDGYASATNAQVVLRCNARTSSVTLMRTTGAQMTGANVPVAITTTTLARTLPGLHRGNFVEITLGARDPLLDAIAFSRGRFMLAAGGTPTLYIPSYTEISRVIQDCR